MRNFGCDYTVCLQRHKKLIPGLTQYGAQDVFHLLGFRSNVVSKVLDFRGLEQYASSSEVMSPATGVFYAFAKNINDDVTWRYMIVFATRDVADSWFRAVQDSVAAGYPTYADVKRVSPQWYTHNPNVGRIDQTIVDQKVASQFLGKVFFTLISDRDGRIISPIPVLNYTDHISRASFYIRSGSQLDTYWYYDPVHQVVIASRHNRTRFIITIDKATAPGTIMIGSDTVYITSVPDNVNIGVATGSTDQLGSSINPFPIKFSSFATDFLPIAGHFNDTSVEQVTLNPGKGERWELV
ncbi:hypothetical protein FRB95_010054 [Tulasnella sp. JGI-2019a]|nr:hypothetical protein FRB95_010054 [Tulasnella sp. JGI-2019a]